MTLDELIAELTELRAVSGGGAGLAAVVPPPIEVSFVRNRVIIRTGSDDDLDQMLMVEH